MAELALLNRLAVAIALKCRKSSARTKQRHKAIALCTLRTQAKTGSNTDRKGLKTMLKYVKSTGMRLLML